MFRVTFGYDGYFRDFENETQLIEWLSDIEANNIVESRKDDIYEQHSVDIRNIIEIVNNNDLYSRFVRDSRFIQLRERKVKEIIAKIPVRRPS